MNFRQAISAIQSRIPCGQFIAAGWRAVLSSIARLAFALTHDRVCAWCRRTLRRSLLHRGATHTICPECYQNLSKTYV